MKLKLITALMLLSGYAYGQVAINPNPIVHDPKNNVQLVQLGLFLKKLQEDSKKVVKTLETAKVIRQYSKTVEFVQAIEESYCVVNDLQFYLNLNEDVGLENEGCFTDFRYRLNLQGIENAVWQTSMAITSTVMELGQRQEALQSAFDNLQRSSKELNELKEEMRVRYEKKVNNKSGLDQLATWY